MKTARHSGHFARFLRTRAILRLFRRVAMLELLRLGRLRVRQDGPYGEMMLSRVRAKEAQAG